LPNGIWPTEIGVPLIGDLRLLNAFLASSANGKQSTQVLQECGAYLRPMNEPRRRLGLIAQARRVGFPYK